MCNVFLALAEWLWLWLSHWLWLCVCMSVCIRFEIWLQLGFYAITLYDAFDLCCRCVFLKVKAPFTILNFIINFVPFFCMKSNIWELEIQSQSFSSVQLLDTSICSVWPSIFIWIGEYLQHARLAKMPIQRFKLFIACGFYFGSSYCYPKGLGLISQGAGIGIPRVWDKYPQGQG